MAILGAIIAGGQSRRFGSDKAAAFVDGIPMIEHVHAALRPQVDATIICGRTWKDWTFVADLPEPQLGPLGGLNAALGFAQANGYAFVLSVPVDTVPLPADIVKRLTPAPAVFSSQYLIGLWPVSLRALLHNHLSGGQRSVRSWIGASNCTFGDDGGGLTNINRPTDLDDQGNDE
jgi:molybdopterin-guanine dinucleotide biosynthesis protein A